MGFFHVGKEVYLNENNHRTIRISFINGKNIHFNKTNLSIHEPHKIIISNNLSCLILLVFNNDNNIYIKDSLDTITIKRLETLVLQMIS